MRPSAAPTADTQSRFSRFGPYPGARSAAVHNIGSCSGRGSSRGRLSEARPAHDAVVDARIDGTYARSCYEAARRLLPEDGGPLYGSGGALVEALERSFDRGLVTPQAVQLSLGPKPETTGRASRGRREG